MWWLYMRPARRTFSPSLDLASHFCKNKIHHCFSFKKNIYWSQTTSEWLAVIYIPDAHLKWHIWCFISSFFWNDYIMNRWTLDVCSDTYLSCFIHPSSLMCPPASFRTDVLPFSRHRASDRCRAYSVGTPQAAGRYGEHFGWHRAWHSETRERRWLNRQQWDGIFIWRPVTRTDTGSGLPSEMNRVQTDGAACRPHVQTLREAMRSAVMNPVLHSSGVFCHDQTDENNLSHRPTTQENSPRVSYTLNLQCKQAEAEMPLQRTFTE